MRLSNIACPCALAGMNICISPGNGDPFMGRITVVLLRTGQGDGFSALAGDDACHFHLWKPPEINFDTSPADI